VRDMGTSSHLFFWGIQPEVDVPCDLVVHTIQWDQLSQAP
jgi:hypothetical protein